MVFNVTKLTMLAMVKHLKYIMKYTNFSCKNIESIADRGSVSGIKKCKQS